MLRRITHSPVLSSVAVSYCTLTKTVSNKQNTLKLPISPDYFPYGAPDFAKIRSKQQFLVDKTQFIPSLEHAGEHLIFLRPPRWGKSQFLSTLRYYYDVSQKKQFKKLFGDLAIGKNPTPLHNTFHVLPLDFSIDVDQCDLHQIKQNLHNNINSSLDVFAKRYNMSLELNPTDSFANLRTMAGYLAIKRERLLILVDEYDRFANKLMLENLDAYNQMVTGVSGDPASSPIRTFYETIKSISGLSDFRSISMGLTPISLADSSGANFLKNISHDELFGDLVGFTKSDLQKALSDINLTDSRADSLLELMKRFYNGYRFFGSSEPLYNSTLCLFFLQELLKPVRLNRILELGSSPLAGNQQNIDIIPLILVCNLCYKIH
jgi:hypothetical protein